MHASTHVYTILSMDMYVHAQLYSYIHTCVHMNDSQCVWCTCVCWYSWVCVYVNEMFEHVFVQVALDAGGPY